MIKWRFQALSENPWDYGKPWGGSLCDKTNCLCCYDVGELVFADIREYTDNYPYFSGFFISENIAFFLNQKISATLVYKGIHLDADSELISTIPDEIPFDVDNDESDRKMLTKAEFVKLLDGRDVEFFVTDPRIILLTAFAISPIETMLLRLPGNFPTMDEARQFFLNCGLAHRFHPYPPNEIKNLDVYALLTRIYKNCLNDYRTLVPVSDPDDPDSEPLTALDETKFKHLKTLKAAGIFAVKNKHYVLSKLQAGSILKLVREPENHYDANAIRLMSAYFNIKTGYVPRVEAAKLAPKLDEGTSYCGAVKKIDAEKNLLEFDLYERIIQPEAEVKRIYLLISDGGTLSEYKLNGTDYYLSLRQRSVYADWGKGYAEKLFYSEETWQSAMLHRFGKCHFSSWKKLYPGATWPMEGKQIKWEIKVVLDDDREIRSCGNNNYPAEWPVFMRIFTDYLPDALQNGNGI